MSAYKFDLFSAFTANPFGGSHAGIVYDGAKLSTAQMQQIAREVGAPATCFLIHVKRCDVHVRFFSTVQEYPMCGHGTLGLMTGLVERGYLEVSLGRTKKVHLHTSASSAVVEVTHRSDSRIEVMLKLTPAVFEAASLTPDQFKVFFGVSSQAMDSSLPVEYTASDFSHLVVPLKSLDDIRAVTPDFERIHEFCTQHHIDTVVLFSQQTVHPDSTVHCREFAPRVGTPEVPAAGTTNRALSCYLVRHDLLECSDEKSHTVTSEQGYEMGRPSGVITRMALDGKTLTDLWVGGVATKVMSGQFFA
jgi:trans-2,3-dihydro-3-hydroxyanthranilate isomerase